MEIAIAIMLCLVCCFSGLLVLAMTVVNNHPTQNTVNEIVLRFLKQNNVGSYHMDNPDFPRLKVDIWNENDIPVPTVPIWPVQPPKQTKIVGMNFKPGFTGSGTVTTLHHVTEEELRLMVESLTRRTYPVWQ